VQQVLELPLELRRQLLIGDPEVDEDLVAVLVPLLLEDSDRFE